MRTISEVYEEFTDDELEDVEVSLPAPVLLRLVAAAQVVNEVWADDLEDAADRAQFALAEQIVAVLSQVLWEAGEQARTLRRDAAVAWANQPERLN